MFAALDIPIPRRRRVRSQENCMTDLVCDHESQLVDGDVISNDNGCSLSTISGYFELRTLPQRRSPHNAQTKGLCDVACRNRGIQEQGWMIFLNLQCLIAR
jgi:hypothetical protein